MADEKKTADKEALKAQKAAEKEALKAKKERIKASKPKKSAEGNIFVRMWRAIVKFFKDFRGTVKKVTWPDRKTVLKNTLIVIATVLIVGVCIWIVDFGLTKGIRGLQNVVSNSAETVSEAESDVAAEAEDASDALSSIINAAAAEGESDAG